MGQIAEQFCTPSLRHFRIENKGRKRFVVSKPEIAFFVCRGYFHHTLGWQRGFWVCQLPKDFKVLDKEFAILRLVCSIKKRAKRVFHQKIETFDIAKNQQKIRKNFWHFFPPSFHEIFVIMVKQSIKISINVNSLILFSFMLVKRPTSRLSP